MFRALIFNWTLKIWALLLAIALSAYVHNSYKATESIPAPLFVSGLNEGLVVASDVPEQIVIQVRGLLMNISFLKTSPPICRLDLSSYKDAGVYRAIPVYVPELGGAELVQAPQPVDVELSEKVERTLDIEPNRIGSLPPDYIEKDLKVNPSSVVVRGAADNVALIAHAVVDVDLTGARRDVTRFLEVKLLSENYQPLQTFRYSLDYPKVRCDLLVSSLSNVKAVRLMSKTRGEPSVKYGYDIELEPTHITVPLDYLKGKDVSVIYTEEIDLSGVTASFEKKVNIDYPFEVTSILPKQALLKVTVVDMMHEESTTIMKKIDIVGQRPGMTVIIQPQIVGVTSSDISLLTQDERGRVSVVIDVSALGVGEFTVRPQVVLDPKIRNAAVLPSEVKVEVSVEGE